MSKLRNVMLAGATIAMLLATVAGAAAQIRELPVPAATIRQNAIVSEAALGARQFHTTPGSLTGIATTSVQIVGKQARRRLIAGKPIPLSALAEPLAVRRGEKVTAVYSEGGIGISATAVALQDGAAGEIITARTLSSGAIVEGVVKPDGSLQVGPD